MFSTKDGENNKLKFKLHIIAIEFIEMEIIIFFLLKILIVLCAFALIDRSLVIRVDAIFL